MQKIKNIKELKVGDEIITFINGIPHCCEVIAFCKDDPEVIYITDVRGHAHELHQLCLEDGTEVWFKDYTTRSIIEYRYNYYSKMMELCKSELYALRTINK